MKQTAEICPAKTLVSLLGQPHVLTVIATLADGVRGFTQLQQATQINSRTLTLRLKLLLTENIVTTSGCAEDARCRYYTLTSKGKKIQQVLQQLDTVL